MIASSGHLLATHASRGPRSMEQQGDTSETKEEAAAVSIGSGATLTRRG
jgi:hypothetical protein